MQIAECRMRKAEVAGQAEAALWLADSDPITDVSIMMGLLEHGSEKATPYRTDDLHVKNGVFDRDKSFVKTG